MPGPAPSLYSPFIRCGIPQANSTTSRPRWMSPLASAKVLPCSEDNSRARSSYSPWISSKNLNMALARRCGLVAAQAGNAASALAMAFSTSDLLASATLACTSPVLGLNTSPCRPEAPLTSLPPMKWPMSRMDGLPGKRTALGRVDLDLLCWFFPRRSRGKSATRWLTYDESRGCLAYVADRYSDDQPTVSKSHR